MTSIVTKKIVPETQFGFQRKLSTNHAINTALDIINQHLHDKEVVGACLVDIEKAFDSTWIDGLIFILLTEGFPLFLIDMIYDMITDKSFRIWDGKNLTDLIFIILEGLMQGTVNSPKLFNILTKGVLLLFIYQVICKKYSIAFADDLLLMLAHKDPKIVRDELEKMLHDVNVFYTHWNLRINPGKCETILFHLPLNKLTASKRKTINNFYIEFTNLETNQIQKISHKKLVKYLGVNLNYLLRLNDHVLIQLKKAAKAFAKLARLMYNKSVEPRAKIILYMLLIRPILTYAAPMWWNTSASLMEKIRKFEGKCLRVALNMYRPRDDKKLISNRVLYRTANIPRIDNFILKLTGDYLAQCKKIDNKIVKGFVTNKFDYPERAATAYFPPHYFTYFDNAGILQDSHNCPIIYHYSRHRSDKTLTHV